MRRLVVCVSLILLSTLWGSPSLAQETLPEVQEYPVPAGSAPHDVAPALDGGIWYTAQSAGKLGHLDPKTGKITEIPLGNGSRPHGVIVGADGAAWVTDGGLNAMVRVDAETKAVKKFPLPTTDYTNLNTAAFDGNGILWYTGQTGYYGSVDPKSGRVELFKDRDGRGPYGIAATPKGVVYYVSLAGSHLARIEPSGQATIIEPSTAGAGLRRVWSDSKGKLWIAEWNSGQVSRFDPDLEKSDPKAAWKVWKLPGERPMTYAVYVDDQDYVWLTDFGGSHAIHRFDPKTEQFKTYPLPTRNGAVRQLLGRPGEVWGAVSGADKLIVIRPR
jgi:virginiamycin B lyase